MSDSNSKPEKAQRVQKALQAPKKRDEFYGEMTAHKNRAYEFDNMSICEFRLGDSPSTASDSGSAENSSPGSGNPHQQALEEMRG